MKIASFLTKTINVLLQTRLIAKSQIASCVNSSCCLHRDYAGIRKLLLSFFRFSFPRLSVLRLPLSPAFFFPIKAFISVEFARIGALFLLVQLYLLLKNASCFFIACSSCFFEGNPISLVDEYHWIYHYFVKLYLV